MNFEDVRGRIEKIAPNEKPDNPRFSVDYMDKSVLPHDSFYTYSNGNWIRTHPIPEDKTQWSAFMELVDKNRYVLGKILEDCAFSDKNDDPISKQLGSFYLSAMDTARIDELKFQSIMVFAEIIEGIETVDDIAPVVSKLHHNGLPAMFSFSSDSDEKNSSLYTYYLEQGGLSLPNRDYYLLDTFERIRKDYRKHVANIFSLYGQSRENAERSAETVFSIELALARSSRTPVELRDPERNYNRFLFTELERAVPRLGIKRYFSEIGLPQVDQIVIRQPEFFSNLGAMLDTVKIEDWKTYLTWKLLHFASPFLSKEVREEYFDFYERKLFGRPREERRWKQVVQLTDMLLGEALGKLYVEREFTKESKAKMEELVNDLREVFSDKLSKLDWMSEKTKRTALEKFGKFRAKIGYPNKFIDYSSIKISPDDFFGNIIRCNAFEFEREIRRVNKPVDRELWEMTPPTVNAYFSPTKNEIVFPAGILQPPFFDPTMDDAVNYGATGGIIAHEITHGFDDEGRKYDLDGNLKDWWSKEDAEEFERRAKTVVNLYGELEALPGLRVNGELTLGENIADIGGISIAYEALQRKLGRNPELRREIDGLTPEQRFYISWAQSWRANVREESVKWQISNDPHSPEKFRGEIPVVVHYKFGDNFKHPSDPKTTGRGIITIW
ncbi:MAG: M13 family metallopeptidase [Candidatus Thermoplasmatota archaeon]|jgi:predicted metalloendopeptidase|nr:M13 family metallopeptidase [Candidatus Thermoplasmatota archaeon]MCL5789113.1 M13 family metallopeptidase [Candidatus Thermoplasmatota archaeon]